MKLDVSECHMITFQADRLHWSSSFLMSQVKVDNIGILVLWRVCEKHYWLYNKGHRSLDAQIRGTSSPTKQIRIRLWLFVSSFPQSTTS